MSRPTEIVRLYETGRSQRGNFDNTYQEIIDHIDPHHRDIVGDRAPGSKKNLRQFDGTALNASQLFADFYQGSVFNQGTKWFTVRHSYDDINKKPENVSWYDSARDIALQHMRNFYGPGGQAITSWALFGNGPVLCEVLPSPKGYQARLKYTSIPWGQYVMFEGDDGKIDKFIRSMKLPAHQIVSMFGETNVSDEIAKAGTSGKGAEMMKEFEILHSILPRDFQVYSKSAIKTNKDYDFASCWVEAKQKKLLKESGYRKFPVAVARYRQISGEIYARGLGEVCLANAKTLNTMIELSLLRAGRELDPPMLIRRNSIVNGILNQQAKGKTTVNDINNSVRPLLESANWQAFDHMVDVMATQINRVFHVEDILNLLSHESPQQTAFQVNARLNLLQQILGPVFGQNDVDFFNPLIDVTLDNLAHMKMLPPAPDDIATSGKDAFNFIYEGPLARAQRNNELTNIQQCVADTGGIAQFFPEAVKQVNWAKLHERIYEIRGVNDLMLSEDDFATEIAALKKQQEAAQMAQMIGGGAEALGKVAPFIKEARAGATQQAA
jgi:hypothetical protein